MLYHPTLGPNCVWNVPRGKPIHLFETEIHNQYTRVGSRFSSPGQFQVFSSGQIPTLSMQLTLSHSILASHPFCFSEKNSGFLKVFRTVLYYENIKAKKLKKVLLCLMKTFSLEMVEQKIFGRFSLGKKFLNLKMCSLKKT